MRKKVGIIKRVSCIGLIFLLSINSFAAIVSDNDGSAFITKSEFDALKSSFQSQIDTYNRSIDSKIDGAIASYLAGIRLAQTVTLDCIYDSLGGKDIKWKNISWTDLQPEPGNAGYMLNAGYHGYGCQSRDAGYSSIKDLDSSSWVSSGSGKGKYGTFNVYNLGVDGNKYLQKRCVNKTCLNMFVAAYYDNDTENMYIDYPYGKNTDIYKIDEPYPASIMTRTHVDCVMAVTASHNKSGSSDLDVAMETYDEVPTSAGVAIDSEGFQYGGRYVSFGTKSGNTSDGGTFTGGTLRSRYVYARIWNTESNVDYSTYYTGFCENAAFKAKLYEGVQLFKSNTQAGDAKIENVKFNNYVAGTITTGNILFAVRDSGFANSDILNGNITLEGLPASVTVYDATNHIYKVAQGTTITFKFHCAPNTEYFIKLRKETRSTNDTDYITMDSGATVTYTAEA